MEFQRIGHTSNHVQDKLHWLQCEDAPSSRCWCIAAWMVMLHPTFKCNPCLTVYLFMLQHVLPQCKMESMPQLTSHSTTGCHAICTISFFPFLCPYFASGWRAYFLIVVWYSQVRSSMMSVLQRHYINYHSQYIYHVWLFTTHIISFTMYNCTYCKWPSVTPTSF